MSDLLKKLEHLSPEKRELVLKKLRTQQSLVTADLENSAWVIKPVSRQERIPLSFSQARLWFLNQLEGATATYNIPHVLHLRGSLNIITLEKAIREIVRRHEILRTRFQLQDSEPVQIIDPDSKLAFSVIDLQGLSESEQILEVERIIHQEAEYIFNLSSGPLLRAVLLQPEKTSFVLSVNMHHIISDGWSMQVFTRELSLLYQAFNHSQPSPLPELPIQYADYTCWQRQWLNTQVLDSQLQYWQQQLAGIPNLLELPTDFPRPSVKTFRGKTLEFGLKPELTEKLEQLSQKAESTLFMTLLASFAVLLFRYSSQEDIVIGSPIANRNRVEIEGLIGFFVNTLVLRTDLSVNPTFEELLQKVKQTTLAAYAHQDVPFEKLVEYLQPERNLSYTPLFQVLFTLQNTPTANLAFDGLTITPWEIENSTTKFDLTLGMEETETGLRGAWEYNTDLFAHSTIERINRHFQTLLESIVNNPAQKIAHLSILTPQEKNLLLKEWNQTLGKYPERPCVHQLFEQQVSQTPKAIALSFENTSLTYQQLNEQANQLAHYLQSLGVKPETLVGLCIERSLDMVIAILAILKAGGAYLPLDPIYPPERLAFMVQDSQTPLILTQRSLREKLPHQGVQIIELDYSRENIATYSRENPSSQVTPDNLIYIIYTSGSTGKPKGVLINHYNVTRLLSATQPWYNFTNQDVWTLFHSYAFDFSVWEIWGALAYGGKLVIVPYWVSRSPEDFYQLLRQEKVTVLNQTPSAFRQLIPFAVNAQENEKLSLKWVIFGGEALDIPSLRPWFDHFGDEKPQLVNMYGITETTVHVTYRPLKKADLNRGSVIGSAIPDLEIYILDQYQQLSPIGIAGEMYIGGAGLARGYLNREDLNEQKFSPNPLKKENGERLYRSGDLARYLENGEIEYLGRIDHQVKIRGFRIELGEIEAHIQEHPDVKEVVVLAREDEKDDQRLVAYVVSSLMPERLPYVQSCQVEWERGKLFLQTEDFSQGGISITGEVNQLQPGQIVNLSLALLNLSQPLKLRAKVAWVKGEKAGLEFQLLPEEQEQIRTAWQTLLKESEILKIEQRSLATSLKKFLKTKCPDYMIPQAFVLLESLPLTSNGKLDRRGLPAPDLSLRNLEKKYIAPQTEIEKTIAEIWSQVLGIKQIGREDNFFELRGHSLLATQVVSRLQATFSTELSLYSFFENPTVMGLGETLEKLASEDNQKQVTAILPVDRESRRRKRNSLKSNQ